MVGIAGLAQHQDHLPQLHRLALHLRGRRGVRHPRRQRVEGARQRPAHGELGGRRGGSLLLERHRRLRIAADRPQRRSAGPGRHGHRGRDHLPAGGRRSSPPPPWSSPASAAAAGATATAPSASPPSPPPLPHRGVRRGRPRGRDARSQNRHPCEACVRPNRTHDPGRAMRSSTAVTPRGRDPDGSGPRCRRRRAAHRRVPRHVRRLGAVPARRAAPSRWPTTRTTSCGSTTSTRAGRPCG